MQRSLFQSALLLILLLSLLSTPTAFTQEDAIVLNIGEVQGVVPDNYDEPQNFDSAYEGDWVQVSGIVTNLIMLNVSGREVHGFFLQETPENSDGDPTSSDGIEVIIGASASLDDHLVQVGDMLTLVGKVEEYYGLTRLIRPSLVSVDGAVDDLDAVIPPIEINPTGSPQEILLMYERLEGMRVFVPTNTLVVAPTHIFSSTNDTEVYIIRADHPVAQREDPLTHRVFRDTHELDDGEPGENLYRISVEANVLKGLAGDYSINLPIYDTYTVFTSPLVGNLVYAYERYTLQIEALPDQQINALPSDNTPPVAPDHATQFSIATFNVENLYDYYDDPFDRQDTPDDLNLNYVPRSLAAYETKITKIALAILNDMHTPDIIAFQELEDQDVCVEGGQLYGTCSDEVNNADGSPDVLQDVAVAIATMSDNAIIYSATIDRDSADDRGIAQGYLYRADRVELPPAVPSNPILGERPNDPEGERYPMNQEVSNPKALNQRFAIGTPLFDRAPVVAQFRVHREAVGNEDYVDIYLSNNHLKSDPTGYVALRTFQVTYNLSLVEAIQSDNPHVYFIVLGDLNSFPESEELAVLEPTLDSLWDDIPPVSRYTYIYAGQSQTLDYIYVTPNLRTLLSTIRVAHINADYAFQHETDASTSLRAADHDPIIATFDFPQ